MFGCSFFDDLFQHRCFVAIVGIGFLLGLFISQSSLLQNSNPSLFWDAWDEFLGDGFE